MIAYIALGSKALNINAAIRLRVVNPALVPRSGQPILLAHRLHVVVVPLIAREFAHSFFTKLVPILHNLSQSADTHAYIL